jgi:SNF2 family DNA or RNA helicase
MRPRSDLHRYQHDAIAFLTADAEARQLIAVMGSGKTAVALHAVADLRAAGALSEPVLVVAPLMIAETVWHTEAKLWEDTAGLAIERIIGTPKQRLAAFDRPADLYVVNYDNVKWLAEEVIKRRSLFSVLIADESSKIKNPEARRTKVMLAFGGLAKRRWTLTGTPRGQQLLDVWAPAQFVTRGTAFPPYYAWRNANFFPVDIYQRQWHPRAGVEAAATDGLRGFTHVVDQAALNTRPPMV